MGLYLGYSLTFVIVWGLAAFFEGFVPLLIYRSIKTKPTLELRRPKVTYGLNALLALVLVGSVGALILSYSTIFIVTLIVALALLILQASVEDSKTWVTWLLSASSSQV